MPLEDRQGIKEGPAGQQKQKSILHRLAGKPCGGAILQTKPPSASDPPRVTPLY